jgi:DNA-binding Lrp family transcriptional regulator
MDVEKTFIKPTLKLYFDKGLTELETHLEISAKFGAYTITQKTIKKWFKKFRADIARIENCKNISKLKFTDEFLIDLINNNPGLDMRGLAKLADTSVSTISTRLKQINKYGERVQYNYKNTQSDNFRLCNRSKKFTDEFLIDLINSNPKLNLTELASLADCALETIIVRLKEINSNGERVKYISKKIQKGDTRFSDEYLINLVNDNPELKIRELAKLCNSAPSTISHRIKQINSDGEKAKYIHKSSGRSVNRNSIENLTDLINDNPDINISELSKLSNTSISTVYRRLKKTDTGSIEISYAKRYLSKARPMPTDENLIELINNNPSLNIGELALIANISASGLSRRIKKINSLGPRATYINKPKPRMRKFTDECLIELVTQNPSLTMAELAKLANASEQTISRRLKQINTDLDRVNYTKKSTSKDYMFTDDYLIDLINNNPEFNLRKLAEVCEVSASTVYNRLKKINKNGERVAYIKKNQN